MNYILLLSLIFLIGSLLIAFPSQRSRRLAALRNSALQAGIQVRVQPAADVPLLRGQAIYAMQLPAGSADIDGEIPEWRLVRAQSLQIAASGSEPAGGARWNLPGWLEQGSPPDWNPGQCRQLAEKIARLPECTDALGCSRAGVFVIWKERDTGGLAPILEMLRFLTACTVHDMQED